MMPSTVGFSHQCERIESIRSVQKNTPSERDFGWITLRTFIIDWSPRVPTGSTYEIEIRYRVSKLMSRNL